MSNREQGSPDELVESRASTHADDCWSWGAPAANADALLDALRQIAEWPDGGERYGQEKIKRFAQHAIDAAMLKAREGER